jgi:alpha-ketoglutarate-dependent taurine dioxygenase
MNPFDLENPEDYGHWRSWKLENAPRAASELIVEVKNPLALNAAEKAALQQRLRRSNMAVYASPALDADNRIPRELGLQFGLSRLDANWLADEDGISEIQVNSGGTRKDYIPYTNRPIKWHTDGYYNPPERTIRAMVLHCVRSAAQGGENHLMDPEIAYLMLRDEAPEHVRALMQPDAMTIPERVDEQDGVRPVQPGPVFSVSPEGRLHMRYTARTRSIEWKADAATQAAVAALERILSAQSLFIYTLRLEPGMGVLCNNVLHDRAAFNDDPRHARLLYRARYYDRIGGT